MGFRIGPMFKKKTPAELHKGRGFPTQIKNTQEIKNEIHN